MVHKFVKIVQSLFPFIQTRFSTYTKIKKNPTTLNGRYLSFFFVSHFEFFLSRMITVTAEMPQFFRHPFTIEQSSNLGTSAHTAAAPIISRTMKFDRPKGFRDTESPRYYRKVDREWESTENGLRGQRRGIAKERYSLSFLLFLFFSNVYRGSSEILLAFEHVALLERNENSPGESTREAFYLLKYSRGEIK